MTAPDTTQLPSPEVREPSKTGKDTRRILQQVAEAARCVLHGQEVLVSVATDGQDTIFASAGFGPESNATIEGLIGIARTAGISEETRKSLTIVVDDVENDTDEIRAATLRASGLAAFIAVPIRIADERIGAIALGDRSPRQWQPQDILALLELAALAGLALHSQHQPMSENDERDRALAQLRRSFDDGLAGHAVATADGRIVACNPEFARIAGFPTVTEALSVNLRSLEPEPGAFSALVERLQQSPLIPLEELRLNRRDGTPSNVLARLAATLDMDGNVTEIRAYLVDITQHVLLEQDSKDSAERLHLLELATQDVLWDWNLATGRVAWNGAVARRFRYKQDEVRASIDWHVDKIHPDDRERVLTGIERAIIGVEHFWTDEYRFQRGDGSYAVVLDRAYIVRNGRGEPERVVGWILDISERKAREDSLRFLARAGIALESALEVDATATTLARLGVPTVADVCLVDLLDSNGSLRRFAVAHCDPARESYLNLGTVVANDAQDSGAPFNAVRSGAPDFLAISDFDASHHLGISGKAGVRAYMVVPIAARDHVLGAATFGFIDGRRHFDPYVLMTAKELAQLAGQAIDNALLYDHVRRAVSTRNEMLSVVTHDLRTPVNTMMATLSILSDSMRERREEVRKWFDMAYRATEQMKSLIEDLLDTSRLEADQFTVDRIPGNAKAIIEEACDMLRPLADDKGISIDPAVPVGMPWLSVDVPQIVRVIGNLVGNAIKFSRRGGHIQVLASRHDQELRISVRDDGNGIPEDQLAMVFDRFWTDRSSDRRGIGLGLAIAKGIVEAHGGRIWVESQKDVGSTFTFSLPIGVDNIEPDTGPAAPPPAGTAPAVSPSRTAD